MQVIGEDLGTVPDEVRESLQSTRVMSVYACSISSVKSKARNTRAARRVSGGRAGRRQRRPQPGDARGLREGYDLEVRRKLDLFPFGESAAEYVANRSAEVERLEAALEREDLLPRRRRRAGGRARSGTSPKQSQPTSRTPARIFVVQLEDVLGVRERPICRYTVEEQPNWRRRLPLSSKRSSVDEQARPHGRNARPCSSRRPRCFQRLAARSETGQRVNFPGSASKILSRKNGKSTLTPHCKGKAKSSRSD